PEPPRPKVAERLPKPAAEPKADIALEKEKKRKEAERLAEVEARHRRELAEAARRDEELRREAEAARAAAQAAEQARQREQEVAQAAAAEQQRRRDAQAAQQAQQARAAALDIYRAQIMRAVRARLVEPPGVQGNPQAELKVLQLPNGEVVSARLVKSSGDPAFDAAAERAVLAASPLPLPADRSLFNRELDLQFRLRD
ncbi:MAG: hypothetical protein RIS59_1082, partial [Pseudomonadota bacterium]